MTEGQRTATPSGPLSRAEADAWRDAADAGRALRDQVPVRPAWAPASAMLSWEQVRQIIEWASANLPNEACGLVAGDRTAEEGGTPTRFVPMRNAAESPYRYLMDPEEQLRVMLDIDDRNEVIWGIVHSHVASPAEPSVTDIGLAAYPDALYLICSLADEPADVRAWSIREGHVSEVVLEPF